MHLVTCSTPQGPLEAAPRTALVADMAEGERWDGFWASDAYYVRRTAQDGGVAWYQLADDDVVAPRERGVAAGAGEARVLALRPRSRVAVVIARSPGGRRMLVGSARRPAK